MSNRTYTSSIHRFITNKLAWLNQVLGYREAVAVSRAQLPRILASVDWAALNHIVETCFGLRIAGQGNQWYAVDGTGLRGVPGEPEQLVLAGSHPTKRLVA